MPFCVSPIFASPGGLRQALDPPGAQLHDRAARAGGVPAGPGAPQGAPKDDAEVSARRRASDQCLLAQGRRGEEPGKKGMEFFFFLTLYHA